MNRNPDGTALTTDQLLALCDMIGVDTLPILGTHNSGLIRSAVLQATAKLRFEMFMRGELALDTSTPFVPDPRPAVDPELFAWAQATAVTSIH